MNCPVCQNDLNLPETIKESMELHYDCPSCFSSLFVKGGKCEVLSTGAASDTGQKDGAAAQENKPETEPPLEDFTEASENLTEKALQEEVANPDSEFNLKEEPDPSSQEEDLLAEEAPPEITEVPILEEMEEAAPEQSHTEGDIPSPQAKEEAASPSSAEENPEHFEFSEEEGAGDGPLVQPAAEAEDENIPPEGEDFADVKQFGNTPAPSDKGAFYYDVTVNDIDSADLRDQVEEVLEDEALKLVPDQVHFSKSEARLVINKISPVQAHVIVKSLLGLSLTISWDQHLIADTQLDDNQPESESPPLEES